MPENNPPENNPPENNPPAAKKASAPKKKKGAGMMPKKGHKPRNNCAPKGKK